MHSEIDDYERNTIEDLLKDFGVSAEVTHEMVYTTSWNRYSIIHQRLQSMADLYQQLRKHSDNKFFSLPIFFHEYIFAELFTFAGKYRQITDSNKGQV